MPRRASHATTEKSDATYLKLVLVAPIVKKLARNVSSEQESHMRLGSVAELLQQNECEMVSLLRTLRSSLADHPLWVYCCSLSFYSRNCVVSELTISSFDNRFTTYWD
jgi:hypothetical protein